MALTIEKIAAGYTRKISIIKNISFEVQHGELFGILGPNGSGKTTLIKCINKILALQGGKIALDGKDLASVPVRSLAKSISYVPQLLRSEGADTVLDMVIMGRKPYINWKLDDSDIDIALGVLKKLNIEELANVDYLKLSGGQKQKVLIARALAQETGIILLDEPASFLDIRNQIEIMDMMRESAKNEKKTVIMVLHDLNMAFHYCDELLLMKKGKTEALGSAREVLTAENIRRVYGVAVKIIQDEFIKAEGVVREDIIE